MVLPGDDNTCHSVLFTASSMTLFTVQKCMLCQTRGNFTTLPRMYSNGTAVIANLPSNPALDYC